MLFTSITMVVLDLASGRPPGGFCRVANELPTRARTTSVNARAAAGSHVRPWLMATATPPTSADSPAVREAVIFTGAEVAVQSIHCPGAAPGVEHEVVGVDGYELCLVRRGCFWLRSSGTRGHVLVDAVTAIWGGPQERVGITHAPGVRDVDTVIVLSAHALAAVGGGTLELPAFTQVAPLTVAAHQGLAAALATTEPDPLRIEEAAMNLFASALRAADPARTAVAEPRGGRRRELFEQARYELAVGSPRSESLLTLSGHLECSPHHLSRIFSGFTGSGVASYRRRLRTAQALDLLADGRTDLAAVAAECGFVDQAHLTRVCQQQLHRTPGRLRAALQPTTARRC
jgi:AraC-like DNA-binding protein